MIRRTLVFELPLTCKAHGCLVILRNLRSELYFCLRSIIKAVRKISSTLHINKEPV